MIRVEPTRHQVAIAGQVVDAQTEAPLRDVLVFIADAPPVFQEMLALKAMQFGNRWERLEKRPDRMRTSAEGLFYFMDLPDGDYTLSVTWPDKGNRYGSATADTTITRDNGGNISYVFQKILLAPTTIKGHITELIASPPNPPQPSPVVLAEVYLKGSGERVFSDVDGFFTLIGVETGSRTLIVNSKRHRLVTRPIVLVTAGEEKREDFDLTPL